MSTGELPQRTQALEQCFQGLDAKQSLILHWELKIFTLVLFVLFEREELFGCIFVWFFVLFLIWIEQNLDFFLIKSVFCILCYK